MIINIDPIVEILEIELPIELRLLYGRKPNKKWEGYYMPKFNNRGKLTSHRISILMDHSNRSIESLIAHELIHAWQQENNHAEIHGKQFRKMAKLIHRETLICDIYLPDVDLN